MRPKTAILITALLAVSLGISAWWWTARNAPRALSGDERATRTNESQTEAQRDPTRAPFSEKRDVAKPSQARTPTEPATREREAAQSESARNAGSVEKTRNDIERQDFDEFKQTLSELVKDSHESSNDEAIESRAAVLTPDDIDRLDLDGDRQLSDWEQNRAQRLLDRVENHPVKNDVGDGAYPVERGNYRRDEREFDAVDTNQDSLMTAEEYHAFLVHTERISIRLDTDEDRNISLRESGLAEEDFAPLDRDQSGTLNGWEIRRAIAVEALE